MFDELLKRLVEGAGMGNLLFDTNVDLTEYEPYQDMKGTDSIGP